VSTFVLAFAGCISNDIASRPNPKPVAPEAGPDAAVVDSGLPLGSDAGIDASQPSIPIFHGASSSSTSLGVTANVDVPSGCQPGDRALAFWSFANFSGAIDNVPSGWMAKTRSQIFDAGVSLVLNVSELTVDQKDATASTFAFSLQGTQPGPQYANRVDIICYGNIASYDQFTLAPVNASDGGSTDAPTLTSSVGFLPIYGYVAYNSSAFPSASDNVILRTGFAGNPTFALFEGRSLAAAGVKSQPVGFNFIAPSPGAFFVLAAVPK
jgi:hypothetical protein